MVLSNKEWLDKMDEIISAIQNGGGDSQVIEDMLSNMWISSATYNVGDYVLYNNNIWKCLVQNSNIAPSEGTIWTRVNITSEISTLNSNLEYFVDMKNNNNIFKFTNTFSIQINCQYGYGAITIYGFMQNYGAFAVNVGCRDGNATISDMIEQVATTGLLKANWDINTKKLHIYVEGTERSFAGFLIGMLV